MSVKSAKMHRSSVEKMDLSCAFFLSNYEIVLAYLTSVAIENVIRAIDYALRNELRNKEKRKESAYSENSQPKNPPEGADSKKTGDYAIVESATPYSPKRGVSTEKILDYSSEAPRSLMGKIHYKNAAQGAAPHKGKCPKNNQTRPNSTGKSAIERDTPRVVGDRGTPSQCQDFTERNYYKNATRGAAPYKGKRPKGNQTRPNRTGKIATSKMPSTGRLPRVQAPSKIASEVKEEVQCHKPCAGKRTSEGAEWPCITEDVTGNTTRLVGVQGTPKQWQDFTENDHCKNATKGAALHKRKRSKGSQTSQTIVGKSAKGKMPSTSKRRMQASPKIASNEIANEVLRHERYAADSLPGSSSRSSSSTGAEWPCITEDATGNTPRIVGVQGTPSQWQSVLETTASSLNAALENVNSSMATTGPLSKAMRTLRRLKRRLCTRGVRVACSFEIPKLPPTGPGNKDPATAAGQKKFGEGVKHFFRSFKRRTAKVASQNTLQM